MKASNRQIDEWSSEQEQLYKLLGNVYTAKRISKRGSRKQRKRALIDVEVSELIKRSNKRYVGINRGSKGVNPVTAFK